MKKSVFSHVKTIFQTVVVVILCDLWILSRCQNPYVSGHLFVASLSLAPFCGNVKNISGHNQPGPSDQTMGIVP